MDRLTAILVDDEFSTLRGLQQKISKLFPDIEVLHTFQKPEDAIQQLEKEQPDLVFLDIEMPRINGFELLGKLTKINFQVIFVTAYSEYALDALKQNAVDYVLKPVDNDELILAIQKARKIIEEEKHKETNEKLVDLLTETIIKTSKIIVPTSKGVSFLPEAEVVHLEGYEGYTKIHLITDSTLVSSYNLGKFEKSLNRTFFKCHKSHIVNLSKVRSFENEGYIVLENNSRVPISKMHRKAFLSLFSS